MPNIKTFDSDVRAPMADQAGSQAYETEGRHIEASYAQAGHAIGQGMQVIGEQVQRHEEIQDTSANAKAGSDAFLALSAQLSKTAAAAAADPANSEKHFQDFQQSMEDTIGQIGGDSSTTAGRKNAEAIQNTLRQEFFKQSTGAQSIVNGQAVITSLTQTKNNIAQAVSNNPSMLGAGIALLQGSVKDQLDAHQMSPEETARIHSEFINPAIKDLGIAAFQTMAKNDPEAAKAALTKGDFAGMFSGEEIGSLTNYANTQAKALATANKAQTEQEKQAGTLKFKQQASEIVASMIQQDGTLSVPKGAPQATIELAKNPYAEPGEIKSLADMQSQIIKDQAKGTKVVSDPQIYSSFGTKLVQGNLTEQEVYEARTQGQLSDKDTAYYLRGIKELGNDPAKKDAERQFTAWANAQKPAFTKASGILGQADPHGMEKWNQFMRNAHDQFEQTYTSKGDWRSLLDAKNSGYLGRTAPQYMSNTKGASVTLTGTVSGGYRFKGSSATDWKNPDMWEKVGSK